MRLTFGVDFELKCPAVTIVSWAKVVVAGSMTDLLEGGKATLSTIVPSGGGVAEPAPPAVLGCTPDAAAPLPLQLTETGSGKADGTTTVSAAVKLTPWFKPLAAEVTAGIPEGRTSMAL